MKRQTCTNCGAQLINGKKFCPQCGTENNIKRISGSKKKTLIIVFSVIILSLSLFFILFFTLFPLTTIKSNGLIFKKSYDNTYTCTIEKYSTKVNVPEKVRGIPVTGLNICKGCNVPISIPDTITVVWFQSDDGTYNTFYDRDYEHYNVYDNGLYLGNNTNPYVYLVWCKNKNSASCTINNNCKAIGWHAFYSSYIEEIVIPNSVTKIGTGAFGYCSKLKSVKISNSIKYLELGSWFDGCRNIEKMYIYQGAESIYKSSYYTVIINQIIFDGTIKQWKSIRGYDDLNDTKIQCNDGTIIPE